MTWKTRFALTLVMSALIASSALAQDATATATEVAPAATVEATEAVPSVTAEAEVTEAVPAATVETRPTIEHITPSALDIPPASEDEVEPTLGAITLIHPKAWFSLLAPDGKTILSNVDLKLIQSAEDMPENAVFAQMEVLSTSQLPPEMLPVEYASDILSALPVQEGQAAPIITEVDVNGVVLGRADLSNPETDNVLYIRLLDEKSLLLVVVQTVTPGDAAKNQAEIERAIGTFGISYEAPVVENASAPYEGIAQSTSPEGFPQLGNADAPVKIIEIGSFDCPHCREFHDLAFPVLLERVKAGQVQFTYVPVFGTGSVPRGAQAALAAICAGEQGKFWEYHDGLFSWQSFGAVAFLDTRLENGATALSLDTDAFNTCLEDQTADPVLQASVDYVQAMADFDGTPTVLMNGMKVDWTRLPTLIDDALLISSATEEAVTVDATSEAEPAATVDAAVTVEATAEATTQP